MHLKRCTYLVLRARHAVPLRLIQDVGQLKISESGHSLPNPQSKTNLLVG
jgi:hypothetical protein